MECRDCHKTFDFETSILLKCNCVLCDNCAGKCMVFLRSIKDKLIEAEIKCCDQRLKIIFGWESKLHEAYKKNIPDY